MGAGTEACSQMPSVQGPHDPPVFGGGRSRPQPYMRPLSTAGGRFQNWLTTSGMRHIDECGCGRPNARFTPCSHPPLCEGVTDMVAAFVEHENPADLDRLSHPTLISICKPHRPPCRIVVNRDSFRDLRFGAVWRVLWESKASCSVGPRPKRCGLEKPRARS